MAIVMEKNKVNSFASMARGESKSILSTPIGIKKIIPNSTLSININRVCMANRQPALRRDSLVVIKTRRRKFEFGFDIFGLLMINGFF